MHRRTATFAALAALAAAGLAQRPALGAAVDYPDQTQAQAFDPKGDGPSLSEDLTDADLTLDPTLQDGSVYGTLASTSTTRLYLVTALGTTSGSTCTSKVEIVAASDSGTAIARAPGATTLPAAGSGKSSDEFRAVLEQTALVKDLVPTCGVASLENASGTVLDTITLKVANTPPPEQDLELDYTPVYQAPASRPLKLESQLTPSEIYYRSVPENAEVLYDGHWSLVVPAGVTATPTALDLTSTYDDITATLTPPAGFTDLTATASAGNANTSTQSFTVYAPGGPLPPATGDLTGRRFADGAYAISFLDKTHAFVGVPRHGAPRCTAATTHAHGDTGCLTYQWDKATNLLQVGDWIGAPDISPTGTLRGAYYDGVLACRGYAWPDRGARFKTLVSLESEHLVRDEPIVDSDVDLRLRKNGSFTLDAYYDDYATHHHYAGSYAVGVRGALKLTVQRKHGHPRHVTGTIGVLLASGKPSAATGLLLALGGVEPGADGAFLGGAAHAATDAHGSETAHTWTSGRFTGGTTCR